MKRKKNGLFTIPRENRPSLNGSLSLSPLHQEGERINKHAGQQGTKANWFQMDSTLLHLGLLSDREKIPVMFFFQEQEHEEGGGALRKRSGTEEKYLYRF
jgi:hypothetical protein